MFRKNTQHIVQSITTVRKPLAAICLSSAMLICTPAALAASAVSADDAIHAGATDAHRLICTELGITPEAMAVFGMNSVDANAAFDRIDELSVEISSLRSMQTQLATKTRSLKQTQKDARTAQTQGDAQRLNADSEQLKADMEALSASIETKQDQIRAAILPAETDALMVERVCEPVGMAAFVPVEFRVIDLLESDYAELLPALMAEKRAIANNEQVDTDSQLTLSRYRRLPAIESARSNLLYNLDAVRGVFNR